MVNIKCLYCIAYFIIARNTEAGLRAVEQLKTEGLNPKFHQLDVTDNKSIADFKTYLHTTYGGLDLLINNAAIAFKVRLHHYVCIIILVQLPHLYSLMYTYKSV